MIKERKESRFQLGPGMLTTRDAAAYLKLSRTSFVIFIRLLCIPAIEKLNDRGGSAPKYYPRDILDRVRTLLDRCRRDGFKAVFELFEWKDGQ